MNKDMKLSEHFTLGELTKTNHKTEDQNIPSRVAIENLRNLCENWLEDLRYSYNTLYKSTVAEPAALGLWTLATIGTQEICDLTSSAKQGTPRANDSISF